MARDALKQGGQLDGEIAVETARGARLMAPGERIIFLKNNRDLHVKNGTLATIERLDPARIEARLDDGRSVGFDLKAYAEIDHGYARAVEDIRSMERQGLKPLGWQQSAFAQAREALDGVRASSHHDLSAAIGRDPTLVSEAAEGRTAKAIRVMQLEAEVRTNPELRADRFVAQWRQLGEQRDGLSGWQNEDARNGIETRMRALAKGLEQDPALDRALAARRGQLGLGPRQALEWNPGSRIGDVGRELAERTRTRSVAQALMDSLGTGRSRDVGLSL